MGTISYVVAESLIDSKNVYYKDNSGLLADNVQDAIDGTCTKFESKVDTFLDKIYPVGSIYISVTLDTPAKVAADLGGSWEIYGKGQTLVGIDASQTEFNTIGKTGGAKSVSYTPSGTIGSTGLTISQIPSHTHTISHTHTTPATNISSSGAHTHSTTATSITSGLTAQSAGAHTHTVYNKLQGGSGYTISGDYWNSNTIGWTGSTINGRQEGSASFMSSAGAHTHNVTGTIPALSIASSGAHTHTVPAMTTNSISTSTSGAAGKGTTSDGHTHSFTGTAATISTLQPYVTVYMYKRVS